jgi:TRAP-type C4-dicarboxylate transport system substrate-binding protein
MRAKAWWKSIRFIPLLLGCGLMAPAAWGQTPVVIKFATLAPEGSSWIQVFKAAADEVQQKTGSAVQFKIYAGGVMGDERDMVRKMHIGQLQAAVLTSAGLSAIYSEVDVLQIPFLFHTHEEVDHVIGKMDAFFKKGMAGNGYVLLGWSEAGFVHLMSVVPGETIDQLKKARVWIWNDSPMARAIFDEAGVSGVPLSIPDVLVGLQTGLVDVVYASPSGAIALQWFTRVKYLNDVPLMYLSGGLVVKKESFEKIAPENQARVQEIFQRHFARLKGIVRKENQDAVNVMRKQGIQLVTPAPDQVAEYKRISDKAMSKEDGHKFSAPVREQVNAIIKAYRGGQK